ncbi:MAG: phosphoadenylyl-sulfate reductase [Phycisphaerales bacterium JB063]
MTASATLNLDDANKQLAAQDAQARVAWAAEQFGRGLAMTSSFGAQSAVMLHLVTRVVPDIPVVWIDTGYLFPETYRFAEALRDRLDLNLKVYTGTLTPARFEALHGRSWEDPGQGQTDYLRRFKVEPMKRAIETLGITCWLAGLRAEQTDHRATLRPVELQDGVYKVHPILNWTRKDVGEYLTRHDLPYHPLVEQGYASIGDTHSTRKVTDEMTDRDGRFTGLRQECGLHLPETPEENQSLGSSGL